MGLPAHEVVFIFSTFLTGVFESSVFNSFQNESMTSGYLQISGSDTIVKMSHSMTRHQVCPI